MKFLKCIVLIFILFNLNIYSQCKPSLHLPFNGNANDSSGFNNHGTVVGATLTSDRYGNPNSAYYFDGINDHIVIQDDSTNDLIKSWTIMAWVKPEDGYGNFRDNHVTIVDKWGNAGPKMAAYGMMIHTNGELEGFTHNGQYGTYQWANNTVSPNQWTHIAVVRSSNDSIKLYINSALDRTYKSIEPQNSDFDLHIGTTADPSIQLAFPTANRFKGSIDNVLVYKCALKPNQFFLNNTDELVNLNKIKLYPNPTNGIVNIDYGFYEDLQIEIFDANGKKVLDLMNSQTIDLNHLSKGLYFIQIKDLKHNITFKNKINLY